MRVDRAIKRPRQLTGYAPCTFGGRQKAPVGAQKAA